MAFDLRKIWWHSRALDQIGLTASQGFSGLVVSNFSMLKSRYQNRLLPAFASGRLSAQPEPLPAEDVRAGQPVFRSMNETNLRCNQVTPQRKGGAQVNIKARTNLRVASISPLENGDAGTQLRTVMAVLTALDLVFTIQDRGTDGKDLEDIFP